MSCEPSSCGTNIRIDTIHSVEHLYTHEYSSPVGPLYLAVDREGAVHRIGFHDYRPSLKREEWSTNKYACGELEYQLEQYFAGSRRHFTLDVTLKGTEFQRAVWGRLQKAAYGHTISYSTLAQKIGRRDAARAVGQAVAANPVVILVPCHRVIRADGSSGDYARNTLAPEHGRRVKHYLLEIERSGS